MKSSRNRTIRLSESERVEYSKRLIRPAEITENIQNKIILGDMEKAVRLLPEKSVDLLFFDPPYNLSRKFGETGFNKKSRSEYERQFSDWIELILPLLKETSTVYVCSDWFTSGCIFDILENHFRIRNRITWEREKGRGAKYNWKNSCEDVWFCTVSNTYTFHVERVKLRRSVIAPYLDENGKPKDWQKTEGGNFRLTHPSNFWTDLTVPFWSMGENTEHPTQKPEKLLAKLILASTEPGDLVFDPFCGSGTAPVTAKKLGRNYIGIERELEYALLTEKRLDLANEDKSIQGYKNGIFRERNSRE